MSKYIVRIWRNKTPQEQREMAKVSENVTLCFAMLVDQGFRAVFFDKSIVAGNN